MRVHGLDEVNAALCLMNLVALAKRTYSGKYFCASLIFLSCRISTQIFVFLVLDSYICPKFRTWHNGEQIRISGLGKETRRLWSLICEILLKRVFKKTIRPYQTLTLALCKIFVKETATVGALNFWKVKDF